MSEFKYISNDEVKEILTFKKSIELAEETLIEHFNDQVDWQNPREAELWPRDRDEIATMYKVKGCIFRKLGFAGFRILSLNRTPAGYEIASTRPTKHDLLSDVKTGEFLAIVDEHWGHAVRTGACAAVAVKHLMVKGVIECAMIGSGYMAYTSLYALKEVMNLKKVKVWSRTKENREAFAKRMTDELNIEVIATDDAKECVKDMKVVITVTSAKKPFLRKEWFAPGVFIYAMGNNQEVDLATYKEMSFYVDERKQVLVCSDINELAEKGIYSEDWIVADLAEVVALPEKGRKNDEEQIVLRSRGVATQDIYQSYWIYKEAERRGKGISLESAFDGRENEPLF